MEGVGSRLGRASSRYGSSATASVFNGPVRKWKKKWVHVSPSSAASNHHNSQSQSNGHANNHSSRLLLCRWTPLSPSPAADDTPSEEPPRRRFRYTPIVVLEEQKKSAKKVEHEANTAGTNHQFTPLQTSKIDELNTETAMKTETQDSIMSNLDLGLCLKGHDSENDSLSLCKEDQTKKPSSGRFWTTG